MANQVAVSERPSASIVRRLKNYLSRSPESRRYARRNWLQRMAGRVLKHRGLGLAGVFATYVPDSLWLCSGHPEFLALHARFTAHNAANNGGDATRLWAFMLNIKQVLEQGVLGDFAELGVWRGNTAAVLAHYAEAHQREVFLFDTFEGFADQDLVAVDSDKPMAFADTSIEMAKSVIGPPSRICHFVQGYFPGSVTLMCRERQYAVVSLDCDLYEPMRAGLEFFYPRMPAGGLFLLHDYSSTVWNGAAQAVNEFCSAHNEFVILLPDKSGSAFFRKSSR